MDTIEEATIRPDELVASVRELLPYLRDVADETERQRRVSDEVMAALRARGLFRLLQPKRFGGLACDFNTMVHIVCSVASACGSTGWVTSLMMIHQWLTAQFGIEAQDEVWGNDPDAVVSGSYAPACTAELVSGGYRITGRWPFASGCDVSQWSLVGVNFPPDGDGNDADAGFLLVKKDEYSIDDDWFVVGLAGTGSKSVICDAQFVPMHRRITFAQLASGATPGAAAHDDPLYKVPLFAALPAAIATPALGILQGAIEDFTGSVKARRTRGAALGGGAKMAEFPAVQSRVATAAATLEAGKALIHRDLEETLRLARAGQPITIDMRLRNRLSHAFIVKLAAQGIDALYGATGGAGLYLDHRIQRAWRDVHAVSHHVSLNWDAVSTMYGQHALGLEPRGQY